MENTASGEENPLKIIADLLSVMLGSAQPHVEPLGGDYTVVGYTIKTGALHKIIGVLSGAGFPVVVPLVTTADAIKHLLENAKLAHDAVSFHTLWTAAAGLPGYDKDVWRKLRQELVAQGKKFLE